MNLVFISELFNTKPGLEEKQFVYMEEETIPNEEEVKRDRLEKQVL